MAWKTAILGAFVVAAATAPADADILQLKDGRLFDGVKMRREGDKVVLAYPHGEIGIHLSLVQDYVIEGAPPYEPVTDEEKAKFAEGLVPFRGKWVKESVRTATLEKEAQERRDAIAKHREHEKWANRYKFETKHFLFESTMPPHVNAEFSEFMEVYFTEFEKLFGTKVKVPKDWHEDTKGKLPVSFYTDRESFNRTGGAGGGALAYYRFVAPQELHFFYDRDSHSGTIAVMFHEANHYLADLVEPRFKYPHWIGEAMAEYFSGSVWNPTAKKMSVGEVQPGRLVEVRYDLEKGTKLDSKALITDERRAYEHYYIGWSFVHFMMNSPYQKKFAKYIVDIARSKKVDRVAFQGEYTTVNAEECLKQFIAIVGVKDFDQLDKDWRAHVDSLPNDSLRGSEQGGLRSYRMGEVKFRAPRLLKQAIELGSRDAEVYVSYAMCRRIKPDPEIQADPASQALAILEKGCEVAPLDPRVWAWRGRILKETGKAEEGERMMALATDIDPSFDMTWFEVADKIAEGLGGD